MLISATTRQLSQLNGKLHEFHFEKYFIMTPSLDWEGENIWGKEEKIFQFDNELGLTKCPAQLVSSQSGRQCRWWSPA